MPRRFSPAAVIFAAVAIPGVASAVQVRVTIDNLAPAGGVALSPFTVTAHDGTFDPFDAGSPAGTGIENIAEFGDGSTLLAAFAAAHPTGVSATVVATINAFGPGIFLPGATGSVILNLDPATNRFLSFGAMVVPSNDSFLSNDSPTGVQLFDAGGNFVAQTLTLTGANVWDAGTEVNAPFGAAFLAGQDATGHVPQNGVVTAPADFTPYAGATTAAGYAFSALPSLTSPVAQISFDLVPEPASLATAALFGLAPFLNRRRRTAR